MVFSKKNTFLVREKFDLAFIDICNPRNMYLETKHDRKIVCGRFGPAKPNFHLLAPVKVRLFVEFLLKLLFFIFYGEGSNGGDSSSSASGNNFDVREKPNLFYQICRCCRRITVHSRHNGKCGPAFLTSWNFESLKVSL